MKGVDIRKFDFDQTIIDGIGDSFYAKEFWPVVFLLSDSGVKKAYVGESTDALSRLLAHL